jgi:hypothetical protein
MIANTDAVVVVLIVGVLIVGVLIVGEMPVAVSMVV